MSGETMLDDALPPISEDDPCGPDLDLEGDADFLNYMASASGQLPASYFRFDPDKDAANIVRHGRRRILVVVWTERDDGERLISVRRATPKE